MKLPMTSRITAAIVGIMAATVLLTAYLNFAKFNSALSRLEQDRYGVLFFDLRDTIERSLRLGASLSALRNTQDALERLRDIDDRIQDITVYDEAGIVLFSTNLVGDKQMIPAEWGVYAKSAPGPVWFAQEGRTVIMGTGLRNAFDRSVGGLILQYSRRGTLAAIDQVFVDLARHALVITLILSAVSSVIFMAYLRGTATTFSRLTEWIRPLTSGSAATAAPMQASNAIEEAVVDYCAETRHIIGRLERGIEKIDKMDV